VLPVRLWVRRSADAIDRAIAILDKSLKESLDALARPHAA
jgi:hypothetical protein